MKHNNEYTFSLSNPTDKPISGFIFGCGQTPDSEIKNRVTKIILKSYEKSQIFKPIFLIKDGISIELTKGTTMETDSIVLQSSVYYHIPENIIVEDCLFSIELIPNTSVQINILCNQ